jgi:orotate phosphoribosyltransferase
MGPFLVNFHMDKRTVLDAIRAHSIRIAPPGEEFTLSSNAKSRIYIDLKKTMLRHDVHFPLAYALYDQLATGVFGPIHMVAGVELGGLHLASIVGLYAAMSGRTNLDVIYVRKNAKDHGTRNLVEGPRWHGAHVVLLEDVITSGQSAIRSLQNLREEGYDVRGTIAILDRREKENRTSHIFGLPFRSLFTIDDLDINL